MIVGTVSNSEYTPESPYVVTHMGVFTDSNCSQAFLLEDVVMKKLTIEYVRGEIEKAGYKLLSDVYVGTHEKLLIRCDKGHEYMVTWNHFNKGSRCLGCSINQKLMIEFIKEETKRLEPNYECISDVYLNSKTKLKFRCNYGHEYSVRWRSFRRGNRCTVCTNIKRGNKKRLTIDFVKKETERVAPGYECISNEYFDNSTKLLFRCDKGHEFLSAWNNLYSKHRCPECSILKVAAARKPTIDFIKEETKRLVPGYVCLDNKYINGSAKLKFRCDKGHIFYPSWNNFKRGTRCPRCAYDERTIHDGISAQNLYSYKVCVNRLSNVNFTTYYETINPYKLKRSFTEHHLDHIYTVIDGFNNRILPQIIANPFNLQMLPAFANVSKNGRSDMTKEELFEKYDEFKKEEQNEY